MFVFDKDVEYTKVDGNTERKILTYADDAMMVKVRFKKAGSDQDEILVHTHPHQQLTYVLSGRAIFKNGDEISTVVEGDSIYFSPNISHGCVPLEDNTILLDVFTPMRKDFL